VVNSIEGKPHMPFKKKATKRTAGSAMEKAVSLLPA
jgi:hypothetical protein